MSDWKTSERLDITVVGGPLPEGRYLHMCAEAGYAAYAGAVKAHRECPHPDCVVKDVQES